MLVTALPLWYSYGNNFEKPGEDLRRFCRCAARKEGIMDKYLEPTRVVTYENCEGAENLLKGNPAQAGFNDRNCVKIKQGGYVLLDFGKEINGSLSITTQRTSIVRASARLVFGESVMEALTPLGEKNTTNRLLRAGLRIAKLMPNWVCRLVFAIRMKVF